MFRALRVELVVLAGVVVLCGCSAPDPLFSASGTSEVSIGGRGGVAGSEPNAGGSAGKRHSGKAGAGSVGGSAGSEGDEADAGEGGTAGTSAGGTPGTGAGGTAGAGMLETEGACKGKVSSAPRLIGDFEQGVTGWGRYIGSDFGPIKSISPGAANTASAALFSGGYAETSGMYHELPCNDVSQFDGISFYAKGRGGDQVRFLAVIPATDPIEDGGDCDEAKSVCWDHPGKLFVLSKDWQQYHVAWSELAQYGWGTKASFANIINAVLWINDGKVNEFAFSIDEVGLYKGAPSP